MPSCTSPNTLCNQCQPLYQRIQRAAAGRIEDVILHEGAYPVLFLNTLVGRNDPNLETELKETLKKRLEDKYRTPVPLHVRVDTVQLQASVCQAGMVIIDFPSLVTVDLNLHKMLFDMTEAGLQGWKSQALQELPGCVNYNKMFFFTKLMGDEHGVHALYAGPQEEYSKYSEYHEGDQYSQYSGYCEHHGHPGHPRHHHAHTEYSDAGHSRAGHSQAGHPAHVGPSVTSGYPRSCFTGEDRAMDRERRQRANGHSRPGNCGPESSGRPGYNRGRGRYYDRRSQAQNSGNDVESVYDVNPSELHRCVPQ